MSGKVTRISDAPIPDRMTQAWNDYVAAQERAKETLSVWDGLAAGKAWGRWLYLFEGRAPNDGRNVVSFGDRGRG